MPRWDQGKPVDQVPQAGGPMTIQTKGANPLLPLQVKKLGQEVDQGAIEAATAADIAKAQRDKAIADAAKAQADAQSASMKQSEDKKIGELRQRDGNLRSLADQIVVTRDAYDRNFRGGWPNFIAGLAPTADKQEFDKLSSTLIDVGQSAFRIPGSGDQNPKELALKLDAYKPSALSSDKANDVNFDYLKRRVDTERKALGLDPVDWQALSQRANVALPSFAPNIPTGVTRGQLQVDPSGNSSGPSELAERFTREAQDAFNNGATREQLDAIATKYGAAKFGDDLDKAIQTRNAGGRASFLVPNDVSSGPQKVLGMDANSSIGAFATAAGNQVAGGRLDEIAGGVNGGNAAAETQAGKDYLREQYPWATLAGDVAGVVPMAMAGTSAAMRLGLSAPRAGLAGDTAFGIYSGSGENNENPSMGGFLGGVAGLGGNIVGTKAAGMFGRAVAPTGGAMRPFYEQGGRPTIGQRLADKPIIGPLINNAEQALQSIPGLGVLPANARARARDQFETGAFNRSLAPLGSKLPDGVENGPQAFAFTRSAFDDAYSRARSGMQFVPDAQFGSDFGNWQRSVTGSGLLDGESIKQVTKAVENSVGSRMRGGQLTGDTYKKAVSDLGKTITGTSKPEVKQALGEFRDILDGAARRSSNPAAVSLMDAADLGYSQFKPLKEAGRRAGSDAGRFTPQGLEAVERQSMGKTNSYLEGNTRLGDYITAGRNLRDTLPNSGTPERLFTGQAVAGGPAMGGLAYLDPSGTIPATLAGASLPYLPVARDALSALLAPRKSSLLNKTGQAIYDNRRIGGMFGSPLALTYVNGQ